MSTSRILIVDDEKNIRLTMSQALKPLGYEVSTAVNGEDALQQLAEWAFDLILLDLKMPGMDGMDVVRSVVELRPDIKIIIVSAHGTVEKAVEAMKLGAVDFIQKPLTPNEIRELVNRVLDREQVAAIRDTDYQAHLALARRCASDQHLEAAIEHVHKALAADPSRPEAFNLLGMLQELQGDRAEAMKNYRVALDLDPTFNLARQNLMRPKRLTSTKDLPDLV